MRPKIPVPTIYLRNKFAIRPGLAGQFFKGQKALLEHVHKIAEANDSKALALIAACGEWPLIHERPIPERLPPLMHIWRLPEWDTLYELMYTFTESDWYTDEVTSLEIEHQDLMIGIGSGITLTPRPDVWPSKGVAGYIYLYDEIRLNPQVTKLRYLRNLNWFAHVVAEKGWSLVWVAAEVTGTPSQVCILWRVPDVEVLEATLEFMTYDPSVSERYAQMMAAIKYLTRQYMHPESTEEIDNDLKSVRD